MFEDLRRCPFCVESAWNIFVFLNTSGCLGEGSGLGAFGLQDAVNIPPVMYPDPLRLQRRQPPKTQRSECTVFFDA